jgi:muramoyltetrapeptide carboxypeptidase LdcA involved in peptidoglycan recycling
LEAGSTIAIFSPSYPGPALYPQRLQRGVQALKSIGFEVKVPGMAKKRTGYTAGSPGERANALNLLFKDPSVHGIICSIGGYNSNDLLPYLDFPAFSRQPKVFMGYSDATAILLALYEKSGLVTFHGPALLPEWGEYPEPFTYTIESFLSLTRESTAPISFHAPTGWTDEFRRWNTDEESHPRELFPHPGWKTLKVGKAEGQLLGGNVETVNMLVGTSYCPDFSNALLFLEATEAEAYLPRFHRALTHLRQCGILSRIDGLLIGRCPDAKPVHGVDLAAVIRGVTHDLDIPIMMGLDAGHTDPKITLPFGIRAALDSQLHGVKLTLLEPVFQL